MLVEELHQTLCGYKVEEKLHLEVRHWSGLALSVQLENK
jgi:hypothetical protein